MSVYRVEVKINGNWEIMAVSFNKNQAYNMCLDWINAGYMAIMNTCYC